MGSVPSMVDVYLVQGGYNPIVGCCFVIITTGSSDEKKQKKLSYGDIEVKKDNNRPDINIKKLYNQALN